MIIIRLNVYTRITSKTLEESLTYSDMTQNCAKIGRVEPSSLATKRVASDCKLAPIVMDGKSNNSIP
jgi:hypothetical protein